MGSKEDKGDPITPHKVFMQTFNQMFGEPIPKKATKDKGKKTIKKEKEND